MGDHLSYFINFLSIQQQGWQRQNGKDEKKVKCH